MYRGIVQRGEGRGRKLGFPTANIPLTDTALSGIFAGGVSVEEKKYNAAVFANQERKLLEAYLLDFDGDLYGKKILITVGKKIRETMKFESEANLRAAIAEDVEKVRAHFKP